MGWRLIEGLQGASSMPAELLLTLSVARGPMRWRKAMADREPARHKTEKLVARSQGARRRRPEPWIGRKRWIGNGSLWTAR